MASPRGGRLVRQVCGLEHRQIAPDELVGCPLTQLHLPLIGGKQVAAGTCSPRATWAGRLRLPAFRRRMGDHGVSWPARVTLLRTRYAVR